MPTATSITVPASTKERFPELVSLILASESMDDEERQYWISILPVMEPQQIENLADILRDEQEELAAIDKKYANDIEQIGSEELIRRTQEQRTRRRQERTESERVSEAEESATESAILDSIANLDS